MMLPRMHDFAHADVDDVGVGLRHRDRADRRALDLPVGDRRPRLAAVGGLPQTAADRAEVGLLRTSLHAADGDRSPAAGGPDTAPLEALEHHRVDGRGRRRLKSRSARDVESLDSGEREQRGRDDDKQLT